MTKATPDMTYAIGEAIADLRAVDHVKSVLMARGGKLEVVQGKSAERCTASISGARLDSRLLTDNELFVALPGENVHGREFAGPWLAQGGWVLTDLIEGDDPLLGMQSGDNGGVLLCGDPVLALATLAAKWRDRMDVKVIGVTGTNGKTTTKDLLAAVLSGSASTHATAGNFNNALGLPLTLLGLQPEHRFAVIEMGASAVGEIDGLAQLARPDIGIITNAAPAHLAEFGSLDGIISGKGELLDHLPAVGAAILNRDSPGWQAWDDRATCRVISVGRQAGEHQWSSSQRAGESVLTLDGAEWTVPLPGEHNAFNLAVAILAARDLGLNDTEILAGLAKFKGSPHRGVVLKVGNRTVIDDAYNANPESMLAAVHSLTKMKAAAGSGRTIAVLGPMAELGDDAVKIHFTTGHALGKTSLDVLLAVGAEAESLASGFAAGGGLSVTCSSVAEAAAWLTDNSVSSDFLLIKGSRSAAMESILPLLETAFGSNPDIKTEA